MSLKWFLIEKVVNFGCLVKFMFDFLAAWIEYLNYYLVHTRQGQLIMLAIIIIALILDEKSDEKIKKSA